MAKKIQLKPYKKPREWGRHDKTYLKDGTLMPYIILMYNSLKKMRLKTVRKRFTDGVQNESVNPLWYQELCATYIVKRNGYRSRYFYKIRNKDKSRRKEKYHDTRIRRSNVIETLKNFIKNGYSYSLYAKDYIEIAKEFKEEENSNLLFKRGIEKREIGRVCPNLIDLAGISRELKNESFEVAKGFKRTERTLEDKCLPS